MTSWWRCRRGLDVMRVHPGTTTDATNSGSLVPVDMTPRPCTCVQGSQNYQPLNATMRENQHMTMSHAKVAPSVHMPKPRQTQRSHPSARHRDKSPWCCRTNCCALRATFQWSVPLSVPKPPGTRRTHEILHLPAVRTDKRRIYLKRFFTPSSCLYNVLC